MFTTYVLLLETVLHYRYCLQRITTRNCTALGIVYNDTTSNCTALGIVYNDTTRNCTALGIVYNDTTRNCTVLGIVYNVLLLETVLH